MGAGSSASPRSQTENEQGGRSRSDQPPEAALRAAASRGDVTGFDAVGRGRTTLCLCKPRRLEMMVEGVWVRSVLDLKLEARRVDNYVELRTQTGEVLAQLLRDAGLIQAIGSIARLATRASVPHDLWNDVRSAGVEVAEQGTEVCYYCNRQLSTAPAFCPVTNRLHPVPTYTGGEQPPSPESLQSAEEKGDVVSFETETGSTQKFIFVKTGRLEKVIDGEWRRPVTGLEVPHMGARTLRDFHALLPAGCMLRQEGIKRLLSRVAILADRAGVGHNLWEHGEPAPTCMQCNHPLHKFPVCPETNEQHEIPSINIFRTPPAANLGEAPGSAETTTLRVRRRLSGPSEDPLTPQVMPLSPDATDLAPAGTLSSAVEPAFEAPMLPSPTSDMVQNVQGSISDECCVCLEVFFFGYFFFCKNHHFFFLYRNKRVQCSCPAGISVCALGVRRS